MRSINPATEQPLRDYSDHTPDETERRIRAAGAAFESWRRTSFQQRSSLMRNVAEDLRRSRRKFAGLMTEEMGKPITGAEAEIDKCALACDWFAANAEKLLAPEPIDSDADRSYVRYVPIGAVLAIMPWNFP